MSTRGSIFWMAFPTACFSVTLLLQKAINNLLRREMHLKRRLPLLERIYPPLLIFPLSWRAPKSHPGVCIQITWMAARLMPCWKRCLYLSTDGLIGHLKWIASTLVVNDVMKPLGKCFPFYDSFKLSSPPRANASLIFISSSVWERWLSVSFHSLHERFPEAEIVTEGSGLVGREQRNIYTSSNERTSRYTITQQAWSTSCFYHVCR